MKLNNFHRHLYDVHSRRKHDQYFCEYGANGICCIWNGKNSNESDYKMHVLQDHAFQSNFHVMSYHKTSKNRHSTDEWNFYSASQSLATVINDPRRPRSVCFYFLY